MSERPSGQQHVLTAGDARAVVTEVGGGIRAFTVGDVEVLDGYAEGAMCDGGRGQTLLPWPNRVDRGRWTWQGDEHQLPLTEPSAGNAIHGLTRWSNWELVELAPAQVHLRFRLHPQPGWPFPLRCDLRYSLTAHELTVRTALENLGTEAAPVAAGAHPYLSAGGGLVDDCVLTVPARSFLPTDDRGIPLDLQPVEGSDHDFRTGRRIGDQQVDEAFGDVDPDPVVRLERPDGRVLELWAGEGYPWLEVFTGDTLAPERRRQGLGVEPMTAPPNALVTGTDLVVLRPGERLDLAWGVRLA
ncbi:MAG: aldose 1-epimerase family protein [Frankiales bacterium]|nr:aldose 1-epimerase family protein [Frankiales bacterium]